MAILGTKPAKKLGANTENKSVLGSPLGVFGTISVQEPLELTSGKVTEPFDIQYAAYGNLALPVVVVLGGITANRLVAGSEQGWWDPLIGSDKAIDTDQYCVVSFDYISRVHLKTQHGQNTNYSLTPEDQAVVLNYLLQKLKLESPIRLVGSSYGGMVGLSFAERFPEKIKQLVCISASDRSTHTARAIRAIQKGIFELADAPEQKHLALSLARQLSILFYRTDEVFDAQFNEPNLRFDFGKVVGYEQTIYSYLHHQGQKFANKNTIPNYAALLDSIDQHRVEAQKIHCQSSFIGVPNDRLVSYESMRRLAHKVTGQSEFYRLESIYGHDAFLKEFKQLTDLLKKILGERDESSTSYASC